MSDSKLVYCTGKNENYLPISGWLKVSPVINLCISSTQVANVDSSTTASSRSSESDLGLIIKINKCAF